MPLVRDTDVTPRLPLPFLRTVRLLSRDPPAKRLASPHKAIRHHGIPLVGDRVASLRLRLPLPSTLRLISRDPPAPWVHHLPPSADSLGPASRPRTDFQQRKEVHRHTGRG